MKQYTLYFEFYDRKMKTKILANSLEEAKQMVKDKVVFVDAPKKGEYKKKNEDDYVVKKMMNIFGMK